MGLLKSITKAAEKAVSGASNVVSGTVRAGTDIVAGRSLDDSKMRIGEGFNKTTNSFIDLSSAGYGQKIDNYSGGLFTAVKSANETGGNLFSGKSVRQNLKDTVRVGAVGAATVYGGAGSGAGVNAALSKGVNLKSLANAGASFGTGSSFVDNVLRSIGVTPSSQEAPIDESNYWSDSSFTGSPMSTNTKALLILAGLGAILFIVVLKKK